MSAVAHRTPPRPRPAAAPARPPAAGRVILIGPFGHGDPGGNAQLSAFVDALRDHEAIVVSGVPATTAVRHGADALEGRDVAAIARRIGRADAVVIAGGTLFQTLHPSCGRSPLALLRHAAALTATAKAMRKPVALMGVGVGALESPLARRLARRIVRAADLLVLGDEESARRLADAGAPAPFRVGADPAWTLIDSPACPSTPGNAVILALCASAARPGLARRLALVLGPIAQAGLRVRLQPWHAAGGAEPDDIALARAVAAGVEGDVEIVPAPANLADARSLFTGARLVVAQRLHAVVAAAAAGVPAVALGDEPSLAGLGRRLDQVVLRPAGPPAALSRAILRAAEHAPATPEAVARERARAEEGMALLRVLLARGRTEESIGIGGLELAPQGWVA